MNGTADAANERIENGLKCRPITPAFGLEVDGIDVAAVSEEEAGQIVGLFERHSALLFRGQHLSGEDLLRFSRLFGDLDEAPVNEKGKTAVEGYPELYVVSNIVGPDGEPLGSLGAGEAAWHVDMSYLAQPPLASLLYAVEIPESGGDTWLAGLHAALDEMPEDLRKRIEGRRIKHDGTYNSGGFLRQGVRPSDDLAAAPGVFHPAVIRHSATGRAALYLGRRRNAYVEGMDKGESDDLLDELWAHATCRRFTYAHRWRVGDLLVWDNRSTMHRRDSFDAGQRRYMLRTQVRG